MKNLIEGTIAKFDRAIVKTGDNYTAVMSLINGTEDKSLTNKLYGLFDGFYYREELAEAMSTFSNENRKTLKAIMVIIDGAIGFKSTITFGKTIEEVQETLINSLEIPTRIGKQISENKYSDRKSVV